MQGLRLGAHAVVFFALWIVLAGGTQLAELVTGAAVALAGALCAEGLRKRGALRWLPPLPRLIRLAGRVLWRTLLDTGVVLWAVVRGLAGRPVQGTTVALRFPVDGEDARDEGRRVLATAGLSLSPNTLILRFDPERQRVLVHQLAPRARDGEDWSVLL